jgi:glycerol kinase
VVKVLVLDIGTSSVRATVVYDDLYTAGEHAREVLPSNPADGQVEFDAAELARVTLDLARAALDDAGPVDGVAITNQRASTVLWDAHDLRPLGPALGWQDLRTVAECFAARAHGLRLAPNLSATKWQWQLNHADTAGRAVRLGTVDTWIAAVLSAGASHTTDVTNAGVTGLAQPTFTDWDVAAAAALGLPIDGLAVIGDSAGDHGTASALTGTPPIVCILGDQQASLVGQGCVRPGTAKITFGTGGMLDMVRPGPVPAARSTHGTFPIAAWRVRGETTWGLESAMLAAGTNVQWLRDGLRLIDSAAHSHDVASRCDDTGGVMYVPALMGLGAPYWDYGARSALFGMTRGTTRPHVVRAVLEGVAHRGADLVEAAEADARLSIATLRIDGGMSENPTFVQALADACGRPIEVAPVREATTRGAALLAFVALGVFGDVEAIADTWVASRRYEPQRALDRDRWKSAVTRAGGWIPALSGVEF